MHESRHLNSSKCLSLVTNVADLSVHRHFLAAGTLEALKRFRAVHLIQKSGWDSRASAR